MSPPLLDPLSEDSEEALVTAAMAGDRDAMERLLGASYTRLYTLCRRICANREQAQDATQNALIAIVRGLPGFDRRARFSTWSHRIASNAAIDELRRARRARVDGLDTVHGDPARGRRDPVSVETEELASRRVAGSNPDPDPQDHVVATDLRRRLADELALIDDRFRIPMVLRDLAQLDYQEIGEMLDIPPGTVRSRISRGRASLRQVLRGTDLDPSARSDRGDDDPVEDRDTSAADPNTIGNQMSLHDVRRRRP